ncbi:homoserine O-acetyltransferase MetX [Ectothiorhodospira lacustris]|uniref:homoserine O-acetyltransferase MetX n=1 Tax=Ectothiorhodospira lacustris TaxID=2899127 RepID=UPI001EE7A0A3|nr:homoserine O-acetyltransferase [Ectothiorhodospira lacustris]MCG5501615.1 homoserine O-acetyltransferase [Ectothiorhodospira lacustris]
MNTSITSPQTQRRVLPEPLLLESGFVLPNVEVAFRTWGRLAPCADNAIVICHALTGSADADTWWEPLFGSGRLFDPHQDFIICSNILGGCYGSTGPTTAAPDGRRWGKRFPLVSIRDQVRAQMALADLLGIRRIRLVIGGSMGGMHALEWALLDPDRVEAVASIASSGRHSIWGMAWTEAQRQALMADSRYLDGDYPQERPPEAGFAAARAIAMITYRSPASLEYRLRSPPDRRNGLLHGDHPETGIKQWLRHHGTSLVNRFDAHAYRILLDAMDTHDMARNRGPYEQVLRSIHQPVLIGSVTSDRLFLPNEQRELARLIPHAELQEVPSMHGHDGFLIDADKFHPDLMLFKQRLNNARSSGHAVSFPRSGKYGNCNPSQLKQHGQLPSSSQAVGNF